MNFKCLDPVKWLAVGWTIGSHGSREIFLFTTMSRSAHRPTQPSVQWARRQKLGADHCPQSVAEAASDVTTVLLGVYRHRNRLKSLPVDGQTDTGCALTF